MEKKYNLCYDFLTIPACLMVVFFHTNGILYTYSDSLSWKISVAERCVVYSAIPIFFMLSGAKLMEYRKRYSTKEYAKKRLLRVGLPFLFWNIFYVVWQRVFTPDASFHSVKEFFYMLLNSKFQERYWFFFPLFCIYAAIPVISLVLEAKNHRKYLWFAVYVAFALNWVLKPVCGLLEIPFNSYLTMPVSGGFLMYVLFGYLVSTETWCRTKRVLLYLAAIASSIFAVWHIIHTSAIYGETALTMANYQYFPSGLTGAAIFVFVKHLFDKPAVTESLNRRIKFATLVRTVSGCCMGVWLTHSLGIWLGAGILDLVNSGFVYRFVLPWFVFAACVLGVWIAKKIPVVKHLV